MGRFPYHGFVFAGAVGLLASSPAQAAELEFVDPSTWGASGVPDWVSMYLYVPDEVAPNPPILVVAQSCGDRSAPDFFADQNVVTTRNQADANGYIVILPEHTGRNCFDSGSTQSLTRDGGGDTQAFAQMVEYVLTTYDGDRERVYIAGGSGGGMMTQAMLAVYPDLFKAGASRAGAPAGCWGVDYEPGMQWSGPCAAGSVSMSAQEWGDLVRAINPDYTGPRPRVMLFHASMDETISYNNLGESIKEWTNVLGLPETPTSSGEITTSMATYDREVWSDDCGYDVLEAWHYEGGNHSFPSYEWDAMLAFFGLDTPAGGPDPYDAACPDEGGGTGTGGDAGDGAGTSGSDTAGTTAEPGGTSGSSSPQPETSTTGATTDPSAGSGNGASGGDDAADTAGMATDPSGGPTAPAGSGDDAGCACTLDGGRSSPGPLGALTLGLALLGWGRRRSRRG